MKVVTSAQMRALDSVVIHQYGIPGMLLMETAGSGVVSAINRRYGDITGKSVVVLCGSGNNGGDGFVIARQLKRAGVSVHLLLLGRISGLKGDARVNADIYVNLNGAGSVLESAGTGDDPGVLSLLERWLRHAVLVVDAIFGTGLQREVGGGARQVIELVNRCGKPVVSVDIPSGLSADTGQVMGVAVRADLTVTIGLPKLGFYLPEGNCLVGDIEVVDIFIPEKAMADIGIETETFLPDLKRVARSRNSYKNSFGHLLIIAGSRGMSGACSLAARAALRAGAGLVTAALPESINDIVQAAVPEVMTMPLPEEAGVLSGKAVDEIFARLDVFDMVVIGPGLSQGSGVSDIIKMVVEEDRQQLLIDADGLNLLEPDWLAGRTHDIVLTPHPGEMARIAGVTSREIQRDRLGYVKKYACSLSVYIVLKGANSLIATPQGKVFINQTGNPGMATAGSGDVLAGITAALMMSGSSVTTALKQSVGLHGAAGDAAARRVGEAGVMASDIIGYLA